jgi:N-sulfoglucosamine sulfohydrolase
MIRGAERPNFVIVMGDDVGWDAFGCAGTETARTPNIDRLAEQSCYMTRFYCSVSQCAPLRAELYTGLYPAHNGVLANARKVARPGVKNVVDHLKPLGYRVGLTGKLHFGLGDERFEKIEGFPAGANSSIDAYDLDGVKTFIQESIADKTAFCTFICSIHAHHPWDLGDKANFPVESLRLPPHYIDTPGARESISRHAAEVELFDQQVGDTIAVLEELDIADDTVMLVLSEQGIAMPRGKWSVYDYGSRALCLARWPGKISPRRTEAIGMYCDIVPTLIDLAGGAAPKLDGKSMKQLWLGETGSFRDHAFISNVHPFWQKAIVTPDYKLIWSPDRESEHIWSNFTSPSKFFSKPWAEWLDKAEETKDASVKLRRILHPKELELYRIDVDPYEVDNVAGAPENQKRVRKLFSQLKDVMIEAGESIEPDLDEVRAQRKKRGDTKSRKGTRQ